MTDEQTLQALAESRRRAATRSVVKYGLAAFLVVAAVSLMLVYVVWDAGQRDAARRARVAENNAVRLELCVELEKLKAQNRADVAEEKRNYKRNLRLLHLKDSPELRRAAEEGWAKKLRQNAARPCPYTGAPGA